MVPPYFFRQKMMTYFSRRHLPHLSANRIFWLSLGCHLNGVTRGGPPAFPLVTTLIKPPNVVGNFIFPVVLFTGKVEVKVNVDLYSALSWPHL